MNEQLSAIICESEGFRMRVIHEGEVTWAALVDVCNALGITNPAKSAQGLAARMQTLRTFSTPGGPQELVCVNEAGLYRIIMRSNKPQAQAFADWVCEEVLPSLRKYGCYPAPLDAGASSKTNEGLLEILRLAKTGRVQEMVLSKMGFTYPPGRREANRMEKEVQSAATARPAMEMDLNLFWDDCLQHLAGSSGRTAFFRIKKDVSGADGRFTYELDLEPDAVIAELSRVRPDTYAGLRRKEIRDCLVGSPLWIPEMPDAKRRNRFVGGVTVSWGFRVSPNTDPKAWALAEALFKHPELWKKSVRLTGPKRN